MEEGLDRRKEARAATKVQRKWLWGAGGLSGRHCHHGGRQRAGTGVLQGRGRTTLRILRAQSRCSNPGLCSGGSRGHGTEARTGILGEQRPPQGLQESPG